MPSPTQAYRTIVTLDIEAFGRVDRDDLTRVDLRRLLLAAIGEALAGVEVPADAWSASSTGDGLLVLVDPAVTTATVLRRLLDRLPGSFAAHNRSAAEPARIRARAILHAGHIMLDEQGAAGEQLNLAFRLLDSDAMRACLRSATGSLVIGVSDEVYRQVVRHRPLGLDPAAFVPVEVAVKEVRSTAWVHRPVSDGDRHPGVRDPAGGALGGQEPARDAARDPVPRQLPAPPPHFTGREEEHRILDRVAEQALTERGGTVVLIAGVAGIGKTALATHWLDGARHQFPDGQLFADLRGHAPAGPSTATEMLEGFLRALHLRPREIQGSVAELSSRFRERTAGRRMLILLDDAVSSEQVQPLKPGPGGSLLVVTSRHRLGGLLADGARLLALDPLSNDAAAMLLARMAGPERVADEPDSAHRLLELCGRLPIALCVAGARLAARPRRRIERLVRELAGEQRRLAALAIGDDISVHGTFDVSYQALPAGAARLYRLAGLHPGPDFSSAAAVAAAGLPTADTSRLLDVLVDASLLDDVADDRFRFHDLLRLHARQLASEMDRPPEADAAVRRMLDWYLASTDAADRAVMPLRWRPARTYAGATPELSFDGPTTALQWLERERLNLLAAIAEAAQRKWHLTAWQLVDAMWSLFLYHKHYREWIACHRIGVDSARRNGNRQAEALLLGHLGLAFHGLGDFEQAHECFEEAVAAYRAAGDRRGEGSALSGLGLALHRLGRIGEAVEHFHRAAEIQGELQDRRGEALTRAALGLAHTDAGRRGEAIEHLVHARAVFASLPDPYNEARTVASLAQTKGGRGELDLEVEDLELALIALRDAGSPYEQARVLELLGDAWQRLGDPETGGRHHRDALALYRIAGSPRAMELDARLHPSRQLAQG